MKLGAIVRCYYLTDYLSRVLKSLEYLDKIIVANFIYDDVAPYDDTEEIVDELNQQNVVLISGSGLKQHEVFNKCLEDLKDMDWVFINDADEFIARTDRDYMIGECEKHKTGMGMCGVIDYAKTDKIYPRRTHKPAVIIQSNERFYTTRCIHCIDGLIFEDVFMHHFGYTFPKDKIDWKKKGKWYEAESTEIVRMMNKTIEDFETPKEIKEMLRE